MPEEMPSRARDRLAKLTAAWNVKKEQEQQIAAVLKGAAELLSDPARWCHGYMALDQQGMSVAPKNPRAVRWCAVGALQHSFLTGYAAQGGSPVYSTDNLTTAEVVPFSMAQAMVDAVADATHGNLIIEVNDRRGGREAVLECIAEALAFAEGSD